MEVIIFMIVLCFLFSSIQKKKSQKVGKKETPVQNRPVTDYRPQTQSRPVNSTQSSMQRSNIQGRQAAVRTAGGAAGSMTSGKALQSAEQLKRRRQSAGRQSLQRRCWKKKQDRMRWSIRKRKEDSLQRNAAFMGSCVMRNVICREI